MIPAAGVRQVGVILIVALLSACETSATAAPTVRVIDSAGNARQWHFDPTSISIKVGETITWTNTGTEFHTVTADDNAAFIRESSTRGTRTNVFSLQRGNSAITARSIPG